MTFSKGNSIFLSLTITGTHMLTTASKSRHDALVEPAGSKQNFDECIPCEAKSLLVCGAAPSFIMTSSSFSST